MKSLGPSLILLLCLPGVLSAHELEIKTVFCLATEDNLGGDECELRIFIDGALTVKLQKDLNRGDTWEVGKSFSFNRAIQVELWDMDSPDADDHLGTLNVVSTRIPAARATARLSRDGAKYEISYASKIQQSSPPKARALNRLRSFAENPKPGKFIAIRKNDLVADLRIRIENPALISQSDQALCGPSAILYLLLNTDPERYVDFARDLYTDGQYRMPNGKTIKPRDHLFTEPVPKGLSPADWMMAASLRDSANLIFKFNPDSQFAGITLPGEMGAWLEGLLGCKQTEVNTSFLYGELFALQAAHDAVASGNVAVLVVDDQLIPGREAQSLNIPNHWVVLLSTSAVGERVKLKIWAWAGEYDLDFNEEEFEDFMWGAVMGYF